jgi:tRNA(Ile)-lysidine synthase
VPDLAARLADHIARHQLLQHGEQVAVGYSGGPDSTCLLILLKEAGYDVVAAHLHHSQRDEADAELAACERLAQEFEIPFLAGKADVPTIAALNKLGIEEAGRHARYEFFRQIALSLGGCKVATAHTLDDHVETILLNLARGAGPRGLAGIPVLREGIVRPLLFARRAESKAFCESRNLWTHDDPSNSDRSFARVRARFDVTPGFETLHERAFENASRSAEIAREEDALLDAWAVQTIASAAVEDDSPLAFLTRDVELRLLRSRLAEHPRALVRRCIRLLGEALGVEPDFAQTESIVEAVFREEKSSVTLEGGAVVIESSADEVLGRRLERPPQFRQPLTVPGETISDALGWRIAASETGSDPAREARSLWQVADASAIKGALYAKPFEPGDRMTPFGADSARKLQDLLTNAKVSGAAKARLPIICDMVGPIWVPGVSLAHRVRVTPDTARRLLLEFGPPEP